MRLDPEPSSHHDPIVVNRSSTQHVASSEKRTFPGRTVDHAFIRDPMYLSRLYAWNRAGDWKRLGYRGQTLLPKL